MVLRESSSCQSGLCEYTDTTMAINKRLYRSRNDRILAGILGGLGDYFELDPVLLRLAFIILLVVTGVFPFAVIYVVAIFIVPLEPEHSKHQSSQSSQAEVVKDTTATEASSESATDAKDTKLSSSVW